MRTEKFPWWKFIAGYLFFILHHQIFDLLGGNTLGAILGEGIEAVFPHMKMLFFAYLEVSLIDYFIQRRNGTPGASFFFSRMLILSAAPWMMIAMYFALEAVGIPLPGRTELAWALVMTAVGIYLCIRLEEPLDNLPLRNSLKALILLAFLGTVLTYAGFSFHVPDNFFYVDG
jgi:hypothetical protein